jgi:hypothetical protein
MKELVRESKARLECQSSESADEQDQPAEEEQATPEIKPKLSSSDHSNCLQANSTGDQLTGTAQNPTAEFARIHKPHKPSANVTPSSANQGRQYTVSIALPGSIVNNAQTWELKTALVGQVSGCV